MSKFLDQKLIDALQEWAADHRIESAAHERAAVHWRRQLAAEGMRFSHLLGHIDPEIEIAVALSATRHHRGTVASVGADFCVLCTGRGTTLVAFDSISSVQIEVGWKTLASESLDAPSSVLPSLGEALALIVDQRPQVQVMTTLGETRSGELVAIGDDAVLLDLGTRPAATALVPLAHIADLIL